MDSVYTKKHRVVSSCTDSSVKGSYYGCFDNIDEAQTAISDAASIEGNYTADFCIYPIEFIDSSPAFANCRVVLYRGFEIFAHSERKRFNIEENDVNLTWRGSLESALQWIDNLCLWREKNEPQFAPKFDIAKGLLQENGEEIIIIASVIQSLRECKYAATGECILNEEELEEVAMKIMEAPYSSGSLLMAAQRANAVAILLQHGIRGDKCIAPYYFTHTTPAQAKDILINCSHKEFAYLVDSIAEFNSLGSYEPNHPDGRYKKSSFGRDSRIPVVERAIDRALRKKSSLCDLIKSAENPATSQQIGHFEPTKHTER